ncbi:MAG: response regulator transcription factor [Rhodocyclaceae bacterium]|nr:response regulator transcription factor [Rhodocyclaceae bacterium]
MKIFIIDDHPLIVEGLTSALHELLPAAQVLSADTGGAALRVLEQHADIGLTLLDLGLPDSDGMGLLNLMREQHPDIPLVVLSATDRPDVVRAALDAGAMGFISKRSTTAVLVSALQLVLAGGVYIPPQVLAAASPVVPPPPSAGPVAPAAGQARPAVLPRDLGITDRQAEVLALVVEGKSNKAICRRLQISEGTCKSHISALLRALHVSNRTQALFAISSLGMQLPRPPEAPKLAF